MTYRGHIKNGVVVLDEPGSVPDGTEVMVYPIRPERRTTKRSSRAKRLAILKYAGKATGLPADASRNIDHYLYGHPKR